MVAAFPSRGHCRCTYGSSSSGRPLLIAPVNDVVNIVKSRYLSEGDVDVERTDGTRGSLTASWRLHNNRWRAAYDMLSSSPRRFHQSKSQPYASRSVGRATSVGDAPRARSIARWSPASAVANSQLERVLLSYRRSVCSLREMYGVCRSSRAGCGRRDEQFEQCAAAAAAASASATGTVLTSTTTSMMLDFRRRCGCHAVDRTKTVYDSEIIGLGNRSDGATRLYARNKCRRRLYYSIQQWFCCAITGGFMTYISLFYERLLQQRTGTEGFNTAICMQLNCTDIEFMLPNEIHNWRLHGALCSLIAITCNW